MNNKENFIIAPAIVKNVSTNADAGLKVVVSTNEMDLPSKAALLSFHNKFCYVAFKSVEFDASETNLIEKLDIDESELGFKKRTKAQRLRGVLFKLHEQENAKIGLNFQTSFDDFYAKKMEEIITHFKSKLDA